LLLSCNPGLDAIISWPCNSVTRSCKILRKGLLLKFRNRALLVVRSGGHTFHITDIDAMTTWFFHVGAGPADGARVAPSSEPAGGAGENAVMKLQKAVPVCGLRKVHPRRKEYGRCKGPLFRLVRCRGPNNLGGGSIMPAGLKPLNHASTKGRKATTGPFILKTCRRGNSAIYVHVPGINASVLLAFCTSTTMAVAPRRRGT
jgi:hypothetical protein